MAEIGTYARVHALEQQLRAIRDPDRDPEQFAAAQARADSVAALFGDKAPPPSLGESVLDYRKRLANRFKHHSAQFKASRMDYLDGPTLGVVEDRIYHDAAQARPDVPAGELVATRSRDEVGRVITRFHGDVMGFIGPFMADGATVKLNV
jgi:hypothetical protein